MKKSWPFAKYVGAGNDFILFDNREGDFPARPETIRSLCNRIYGIGADGVLLLELSGYADCRMRIFNSDGTEAEMCGNGLRCFVKWLSTLGITRSEYNIEVMHRILKGTLLENGEVKIETDSTCEIRREDPVAFQDQRLVVDSIDTGVPHAVIFTDNVDKFFSEELGSFIRNHPVWQPKGTNVTLVEKITEHKLKIRTYERGVEAETLSCGTGAIAAALVDSSRSDSSASRLIQTRSGENLTVDFTVNRGVFSNVTLTGSATNIFTGEIKI